jgi:hypothetical protein
VAGGSLWPGIVLHGVVDLVNGYALGPLGAGRERIPETPEPPASA